MAKGKSSPGPDLLTIGVAAGAGVGLGILIAVAARRLSQPNVLQQMRENILRDQVDPDVRALAFKLVEGVEHTNPVGRLKSIYAWVTAHLRWTPDPASFDRAAPLRETLKIGGGDCDCLTTAFCTLAEAAGHKVVLMTVPGHVFAVARLPSAGAASVLNAVDVGTIATRDAGGAWTYWLPFDPSLEQGTMGLLAPETLEHFIERRYQLHEV